MEMSVANLVPTGLTHAEAERRLATFGANVVEESERPRWLAYLGKFWAPIPWLLELAIVMQLGLQEYVDAAVIAGLLLFNATLGFLQEGRASAAVATLKQRLAPTALTRRDGEWVRIEASRLVPGDVIRLPLGAMVTADARILSGSAMVDQSTLTGESIPVDADPGIEVYAGSIVRRGMALAEVTSTGAKPRFGRTAELVRIGHAASTEQRAIFGATRNLALMNGSLAVGIVAYAHSIAEPANDLVRLIGLALFWLPARALFRFGPLHLDDLTVCLGAGLATIIGLDLLKPLWRRHLAT